MAKCDLSIELDDPNRVYDAGETITGVVHVAVDKDVTCKGLEIQSGWRTHGRGNVAKGTFDKVTVFQGDWTAGQTESYRFELRVADWPPSYHGNYINVDHYIDVRAKIPWAFDPKASADFLLRPTQFPEEEKSSTDAQAAGCVGYIFVGIFLAVFIGVCTGGVGALMVNPIVGVVILVVALPIIGLIAGRYLLPKWLLGKVEYELLTPQVSPGGTVRAKLGFQPKRQTSINCITASLVGAEVCVSGSGSNRTTHRNTFFDEKQTLREATVLRAGVRQDFELEFQVPSDVPYSFDLVDNDLKWSINLRVDIPRWPDWTTSMNLQIVPDGTAASSSASTRAPAVAAPSSGGEITFAETASHIYESRDNPEQLELLIEAVTGMTFEMDVFVERRLLYSGDEDPHLYEDGYAVWARHSEPPLPMVLYVPHELGDEFEQAGRDLWRCRGMIVGWDHDHRRLQVKVVVPTPM